ncbi:uncharacterized protein FOMMEDRAFT_112698 [Fomitiporia mediterranea MF3/22]|uniref:uncharacterized protein n=1 Tax=Fomitiporia mediterranea (strain MF3/22) TaxID=694068 RepID=UPI0004409275|nr:uncharacterized protein FOMMEDRAFT_112698 [Fomitiporia mediterranea MF3/22]EJC99632.1 hypothetical protein FOMMEDRAFT_112698 [Fomitiporia mediterranea MF3/22]
MASPVDCSALPNPETPLAFLPPNIASQLEVSRYIYVASLGAFIWDILSNVPSDYKLLFKHRISLPTVVYFFSRITAFAYVVTSTVFQIGSVGDCQALQVALAVCFVLAVSSTSLLFFFRIRAIFNDEKLVVALFGFLWLCVFAGCMTVPFAIQGTHIGPTVFCVNSNVKPYSSAGIVISAVNDTLVLIAISLRILYNASIDDNVGARVKAFWNGGALPNLSKSILQSGQQYYLITVGGNILTMVMILAPSVAPVYRAMFTIPNVMIENSMACKVFRDIKFGLIEPTGQTTFQRSTLRSGGISNSGYTGYSTRYGQRTGPKETYDTVLVGSDVTSTTVEPYPGRQMPMELNLVGTGSRRPSSTYERSATDVKFGGVDV